jgi:hypothetical protein
VVEYVTDEELVKKVREYSLRVNGQPSSINDGYYWLNPHMGMYLSRNGVSARPGGYSLLYCYKGWEQPAGVLTLGLDYAFDIEDEYMDRLRGIVVTALEQEGVDFVPLSFNAFSRLGVEVNSMQLVDRVGVQCVFSARQNTVDWRGYTLAGSTDRQYFISGYDANETPPLYFLARLPHEVETYQEAIESLKPESVKLAEKAGLEVLRQGDMFAIPTEFETKDLEKMDATFFDGVGLYGTAHYAEGMARLPDGTQLGRGVMKHRPTRRNPDHHDLTLPAGWYLIVKNTVPIAVPPQRPGE